MNQWKSIKELIKESHRGYVWVRFKPDPDIDLPAYTSMGRIATRNGAAWVEAEGFDQTDRVTHYMVLKPPSPP